MPTALPRTLTRIVVAVVLIAVGAMVLPRPLLTLQMAVWAIGAALLVWSAMLARNARGRRGAWAASVAVGLAAIAVVVFTPQVVTAFPPLLAVLLALNALRLFARAVRRQPTIDRGIRVVYALANSTGAVLVWLWPDVALLLLAWLLAAGVIATGLVLLWRAIRPTRAARPRRGTPLAVRAIGAVAALALAVAAGAGATWVRSGVHHADDFYSWDGPVTAPPGELLRVAPYEGEAPDGARALRILYATTYSDGSPALASAVVAVPTTTGGSERTVMAWQHGTTGVAQTCGPSLGADALTEYAVPGISRMIERDMLVVATDYPGQGTAGRYPYLIGQGEARATLDGVRAARQLDDAHASDRVLLWGHSQGGHATLWAGQIARDYAPELEVIGVAALSAAADPLALAEKITGSGSSPLGDVITSYVLVPYADEYDDLSVEQVTHPAGATFARAAATRCAVDTDMLVSVLVAVGLGSTDELYRLDLTAGVVHDRLVENIASGTVDAPLFLGQGVDDEVIPIAIQRDLSARVCAAGQPVSTHEYPGRTHMGVIAEDSPLIDELFAWADAVLAGGTPTTC